MEQALISIAAQAYREPREAGVRLLSLGVPLAAIWPAFGVIVLISVLIGGISDLIRQFAASEWNSQIVLTEGALYPTLHKLEADGLVVVEKEYNGRRVRKYYRLTPAGATATTAKIREFEEFVRAMRLILNPKLS